MASKVMVKIPVAPFGQVNKSKNGNVNGELVTVTRSQDINTNSPERLKGPDSARVAQLEQNIRFLKEQHQLMLTGLHNEVETLRNRNQDLQFQLVFVKGSIPSSPSSSSEEDTKPKVFISPKQLNITPLQVELLEKELGELKLQLQEIESRNVYLSAIVDEQKKKLERYERDREKERERALQPDPELLRKLDDAETIIRRLRRENSDLRRENYQIRDGGGGGGGGSNGANNTTTNYQQRGMNQNRGNSGGGGGSGNNSRHHRGNNGSSTHYNNKVNNWFPPLHSQNYWQNNSSRGNNGGGNNERNIGNSSNNIDNNALPSLQGNNVTNSPQYHQQGSRRGSNNNHYHNGDGRKYRGGQNKASKPS